MPNYIEVRVAMLAEDMEKNALNEKGEFDLDVIRPMPDELNLTEGSFQQIAVRAARALDEEDEAALKEIEADARLPRVVDDVECRSIDNLCALGKRYLRNEALYGAQTWYGWRIDQWGRSGTCSNLGRSMQASSRSPASRPPGTRRAST